MNIWLRIILASFTVFRIGQFIVQDDGPFDVLYILRDKLGVYDLDEAGIANTGAGRLLQCFHCVAKWVAIPIGLAVIYPTNWSDIILVILGLAGIASALFMKFRRAR